MNRQPEHNARSRSRNGITLLAVLTALLVIAAAIVWFIAQRPDDATRAAHASHTRQDVARLLNALNDYRVDNRAYPSNDQGLEALIQAPGGLPAAGSWREGGYIDRLPEDPWGRPYQYLNPGLHGPVDVYSLGADGVPGGRGTDADIGYWHD